MNFNSHKPIFKQIADFIIDQVISNRWKAGDRIPSVRELAADVEVNPNTVARTFALLNELGIIYNQRGIGYFIEKDAHETALQLKKKEFLEQELPELLRKMTLLDIDFNQIKLHYDKFRNEKK